MMPKVERVEFVLTIIVIPVTFLLLAYADYSAANEIIYGMVISIAGFFLGLMYAFFKVIRIYTHNTNRHQYYPGRRSLTLFAVFSIILLFTSIFFGIKVMSNFNKGLKPFVARTFWGKRKSLPQDGETYNINEEKDHADKSEYDIRADDAYDSYKGAPQPIPAIIVD